MKKLNIAFAALGLLALTACDSYLDKLPDDRAEVNTTEKARQLISSAYMDSSPVAMMEYSSDNVTDNGRTFTADPLQDQVYRWKDIDVAGNDAPRNVWGEGYRAIGNANEVLASLDRMTGSTAPLRAEALLCRAWAMLQMSNAFCMAYNPETAGQYLGLPYPKEPGVSINSRGTLAELYANINADIEEALPLLNDAYLSVPAYHFNRRAAYAFAARFNLYYQNWEKAEQYATEALGTDPSSLLRRVSRYGSLAGSADISNAYISTSENANFMLQTAISNAGRWSGSRSYARYNCNMDILQNELALARMPWGAGTQNNLLYESHLLFGNQQVVRYPKMTLQVQYTNSAQTAGYFRIVDAVFTADETLLVRAEARILQHKFDQALADMNLWMSAHCAPQQGTFVRPTLTLASLQTFFDGLPTVRETITDPIQMGIKKALHPQGFTIDADQTTLLYALLQMRRIETWWQGMRWMDIKRYGIAFTHMLDRENNLDFKTGDLRGAIQLPADVIAVGLEANPR